jgi:hypothetical protein
MAAFLMNFSLPYSLACVNMSKIFLLGTPLRDTLAMSGE